MEVSALRLVAVAVCVAALGLGGFAAGRASVSDETRGPPQALPAARRVPPAPKLPPAVGVPQLKYDQPGQSFTP
jgi:hypothetical protein